MANSAREGLRNTLSKIRNLVSGDLDFQPTIRPVLDLSDVDSKTQKLNAMLSRTQALSIGMYVDNKKARDNERFANKTMTYQFTQNNYSPKALSRREIYRQTKNQFSILERKSQI